MSDVVTNEDYRVGASAGEIRSRSLIVYSESDLRNTREIGGWVDVLTKDGITQDVWWSNEELFPCAFTIKDAVGTTEFTVEQIVKDIDQKVLQTPSLRFPDYRLVDLADSLEGKHSH